MGYLLMEIILSLTAAFVVGVVAQKFKQSAIIGYLIAGAILGPLLFNADVVRQVAELGVASGLDSNDHLRLTGSEYLYLAYLPEVMAVYR
jgi:hypothetical protein